MNTAARRHPDITVTYHRPLVNKRKIWVATVPYGKMWRSGADQNTTIEFSDPVTIEGKVLPMGACSKGDLETATREIKVAAAGASEYAKQAMGGLVKRLEAKEDINK